MQPNNLSTDVLGLGVMHVVLAKFCAATKVPCIQPCFLDRADVFRADIMSYHVCTYVDLILEVVSVVVPISTEGKALRMCIKALVKSAFRHMQALVHKKQAQGRQAHDRRCEAALVGDLYVLESSFSGPNRAFNPVPVVDTAVGPWSMLLP